MMTIWFIYDRHSSSKFGYKFQTPIATIIVLGTPFLAQSVVLMAAIILIFICIRHISFEKINKGT
jgi:hypothetical protein